MSDLQFHYTDSEGHNGIGSAPVWRFRASRPPGDHPVGAYFTDYDESTPLLAHKLRIPKKKLAFVFAFRDAGDLLPLPGGRGLHIFYSPVEYTVREERQVRHSATGR